MSKTEFRYMTVIAASPEDVWKGLTSGEFTRQYWHGTRIQSDFRQGSTLEFLLPDGEAGVCGEVLEADYPKRLSYTWQFMRDPECKNDPASRVIFELQALNVGTRLTVVHDELDAGCKTADMVSFGWPHVLAGLKTLLETGEAIDFSAAEDSDCPGQQAASA